MPRVVKDPEVRRQEMLDTVEVLFNEKGYEDTTIGDIVDRLGVAHGLFYYYFRSKSDALKAVIDRYIERLEERSKEILEDPEPGAPEKMLGLFRLTIEGRKSNRFLDYLHEEKNALIHYQLDRRLTPLSIAFLTRVVEGGVEQGVFDTRHPLETAGAVLMLLNLVQVFDDDPTTFDIRRGLPATLQEQMERLLGAEKGTLDGFEDLWEGLEVDYR